MTHQESEYLPVRLRDIEFLKAYEGTGRIPGDMYRESEDLFQQCGIWVKKDVFLQLAKESGLEFVAPEKAS